VLGIDRQSAVTATRRARKRKVPAFLSEVDSLRDWNRPTAAGARQHGRMVLPILLVIVLAVATLALSPATAEVCAKLEDFPCGP